MSPNCMMRLVNYQSGSITSWYPSSSPWHAIYHDIPAISSATDRQKTGRNDDDFWSVGLNLTSSNTSPKSHSATPATSRQSAASTKMRSELPLKAAHQNCLMADRRPLLQQNRLCQGRQELFWHNCTPVTAEYLVSTLIELTRQRATIATAVVSRLLKPTTLWLPFEADHTDRIVMDYADRNCKAPQPGDWWDELTTTTVNYCYC